MQKRCPARERQSPRGGLCQQPVGDAPEGALGWGEEATFKPASKGSIGRLGLDLALVPPHLLGRAAAFGLAGLELQHSPWPESAVEGGRESLLLEGSLQRNLGHVGGGSVSLGNWMVSLPVGSGEAGLGWPIVLGCVPACSCSPFLFPCPAGPEDSSIGSAHVVHLSQRAFSAGQGSLVQGGRGRALLLLHMRLLQQPRRDWGQAAFLACQLPTAAQPGSGSWCGNRETEAAVGTAAPSSVPCQWRQLWN